MNTTTMLVALGALSTLGLLGIAFWALRVDPRRGERPSVERATDLRAAYLEGFEDGHPGHGLGPREAWMQSGTRRYIERGYREDVDVGGGT